MKTDQSQQLLYTKNRLLMGVLGHDSALVRLYWAGDNMTIITLGPNLFNGRRHIIFGGPTASIIISDDQALNLIGGPSFTFCFNGRI